MPDKSDITRLAIGYSIPWLPFLRRAAEALDAELVIKLEPK
jgi:hypothetical protein